MTSADFLFLIVIFVPLGFLLLIVYWAAKNGIGPSPTTEKQKRAIFAGLPANVEGDVFELGSGWGGLAFALAKHYPGCRIIGVENSPIPYIVSRIRQIWTKSPNLEFRWSDVQKQDLTSAALIVCYLHTGAMKKLKPKLEKELSGKTWIVSNTFSFRGWDALNTIDIGDIYHSKVFVYHR